MVFWFASRKKKFGGVEGAAFAIAVVPELCRSCAGASRWENGGPLNFIRLTTTTHIDRSVHQKLLTGHCIGKAV